MIASSHPSAEASVRHDFVLLFDVQDGNPNGDPDAGNQPRLDPETTQGIVTDVALKRKVRDYVDIVCAESLVNQSRNKIYVQRDTYLTETRRRVFRERGDDGKDPEHTMARKWMCDEFYDVRMFGAVMSMREKNAGQVRGPVQLTFARSIDPILPMDSSIARVALEKVGDARDDREDDEHAAPTHGTLGRKPTVPYGLYKAHGFFNPHYAMQTGVNSDDLSLFWNALINMWELDRSAARGMMACRGLYVFSHDSPLGNAPAHQLFERIAVTLRYDNKVPRQFGDYAVTLHDGDMPEGVTVVRLDA